MSSGGNKGSECVVPWASAGGVRGSGQRRAPAQEPPWTAASWTPPAEPPALTRPLDTPNKLSQYLVYHYNKYG